QQDEIGSDGSRRRPRRRRGRPGDDGRRGGGLRRGAALGAAAGGRDRRRRRALLRRLTVRRRATSSLCEPVSRHLDPFCERVVLSAARSVGPTNWVKTSPAGGSAMRSLRRRVVLLALICVCCAALGTAYAVAGVSASSKGDIVLGLNNMS